MVTFLRSSELLVFDLEAYVPKEDRRRKTGAALAINPYKPGHMLLGGVFHLSRPMTGEVLTSPEFEHHWIWDSGVLEWGKEEEAEVVSEIYAIFSGMRQRASGKKHHHADPVVAGVGISMFDMPCIFSKCLEHEVDSRDEIYETVCKMRVVDLAVAGIGFVSDGGSSGVLYPRTHNALADRFLPEREKKPTGKVVWDMVDSGEFGDVMRRCEREVKEMVGIARGMCKGGERK